MKECEYQTELFAGQTVRKDHPGILFRGALDCVEAQCLLAESMALHEARMGEAEDLGTLRELLMRVMRAHALNESVADVSALKLDARQLREHSHNPMRHYGIAHYAMTPTGDVLFAQVNLLRSAIRQAECAAVQALCGDQEPEEAALSLLTAINRASSAAYIVQIRMASGYYAGRGSNER